MRHGDYQPRYIAKMCAHFLLLNICHPFPNPPSFSGPPRNLRNGQEFVAEVARPGLKIPPALSVNRK